MGNSVKKMHEHNFKVYRAAGKMGIVASCDCGVVMGQDDIELIINRHMAEVDKRLREKYRL
jgi:hypothetical protein